MPDDRTISGYLEAIASAEPTPGGGSVSAVAGAMGAALGEMVCTITIASGKAENATGTLQNAATILARARSRLSELALSDEQTYANYRHALALPKSSTEERTVRTATLQASTVRAAEIPLDSAGACVSALEALVPTARFGSRYAISDVLVGTRLLHAAARGSMELVLINVGLMKDSTIASRFRQDVQKLTSRCDQLANEIDEIVRSRSGT